MAEPTATPPGLPDGGDFPTRRRLDPMMLSRGFDAAADVILSLLKHTHEMETADLTVAGGDQVRITCLSEVDRFLETMAGRVRRGNVL